MAVKKTEEKIESPEKETEKPVTVSVAAPAPEKKPDPVDVSLIVSSMLGALKGSLVDMPTIEHRSRVELQIDLLTEVLRRAGITHTESSE